MSALDMMPWILLVQIWLPNSTISVLEKEYANYQECWQARVNWQRQPFTALCVFKGGN